MFAQQNIRFINLNSFADVHPSWVQMCAHLCKLPCILCAVTCDLSIISHDSSTLLLWFYPITFLSAHKLVHLVWTALNKQNLSHSGCPLQLIDSLCKHAIQFLLEDPGATINTYTTHTHAHTHTPTHTYIHTHTQTDRQNRYISVERLNKKKVVLTTKLLLTFSKMRFSFSAIASPFLFFTRFFSSFLQAYILPVARTWQAQTWKTRNEETWSHTCA